MTTKERLKRLESYSVCDNYREKEEDFREIEKALEVLEILKNESDDKRIIERNGIASFHLDMILTTDNYRKIKEWLGKWIV